ncbi:RHS repeat-associated core domain-containing protein [Alishewanella sp. HH-ZS]|uniref:RHS repeat-associated core domain-containing protein n=1 Tax=Alishewanella sp. HH-ZS TaxID=1856684 RepID=UPI0008235F69|nr:RHS repeat-associated core domain-containing protein [Alishewanella sp. HH-ZS]OCW96675.1 hypothetical protein A9165_10730 [Alishewanella sp. HH-ZS]
MGNQTHQYSNGSLVRQIDYNAIGKPSRIRSYNAEAESGRTAGDSFFTYDGSRNLVKRHVTEQGRTQTFYQHGGVELIKEGTNRRYRRTFANAIVERSGNTLHTSYVYTDHLGSVDVITNALGQLLEKLSFDAFGKRRQVYTAAHVPVALSLASILNKTSRGFTGHLQVDHASIVHMGGRIYDSHIGRFLQADPFVQSPSNSQNFNRYSYVLNNPLSYTDPSGYLFKSIKKHWRTIASIAVMFIPGVNVIVLGALSGYIASGSLQGALIGAFTAGMGGIQAKGLSGFLLHGAVGGLASKMSGGKFAHGFISAGVSSLASGGIGKIDNAYGRTIARAIVGGTVSKMTGGKFGNGAFAAGFAQALGEAINTRPAPELSDLDNASGQLSNAMYNENLAEGDSVGGYTLQVLETHDNLYAGVWGNADGHTIVAYRGTATLSDWGDNFRQAFGLESKQYRAAMGLAADYHARTGGNIHFTGHSLGGGLAAASAIRVGGSATIFNAAGLHANTIKGHSPAGASIKHYRSSTDALRLGNALSPTRVYGQKVSLGPAGWHMMSDVCRRTSAC